MRKDTPTKGIKISVVSSHEKTYLPANRIKASTPAADGTVTLEATPDVDELKKAAAKQTPIDIKLTLTAADTYGLKSPAVTLTVRVQPAAGLLIKLSTSDSNSRGWAASFWAGESTIGVKEGWAADHKNYQKDIRTEAFYKLAVGPRTCTRQSPVIWPSKSGARALGEARGGGGVGGSARIQGQAMLSPRPSTP